MISLENFIKLLEKNEYKSSLCSSDVKKEGIFSILFYKASISLIPKPYKGTIRKEVTVKFP